MKPRLSLAAGAPTIYVSETPAELIVFKGAPILRPSRAPGSVGLQHERGRHPRHRGQRRLPTPRRPLVPGAGAERSVALRRGRRSARRLPPHPARSPPRGAGRGGRHAAGAAGGDRQLDPPDADRAARERSHVLAVFDGAPNSAPSRARRSAGGSTLRTRSSAWSESLLRRGPRVVRRDVARRDVVRGRLVPKIIYTIPAASALHYVTYVHVYGSTAKVVYVGYTPGYLGTVVSPTASSSTAPATATPRGSHGVVPWPPPMDGPARLQPGGGHGVRLRHGRDHRGADGGTYYHPALPVLSPSVPRPALTSRGVRQHGVVGDATAYSTSGRYGQTASGGYTNYRTGTGTYSAQRGVDYSTATASRGYDRTFTTPGGTSGDVNRSQSYDAATGRYSYSSSVGPPAPRDPGHLAARGGQHAVRSCGTARRPPRTTRRPAPRATPIRPARSAPRARRPPARTTYTNPTTGQTKTYGAAQVGTRATRRRWEPKDDGSGSEHTTPPAVRAGDVPSSVNSEQAGRSQGESRFSSFSQKAGAGPVASAVEAVGALAIASAAAVVAAGAIVSPAGAALAIASAAAGGGWGGRSGRAVEAVALVAAGSAAAGDARACPTSTSEQRRPRVRVI